MAPFHWRDWLFSAKAFAGSMLALYVALAADLPRPYWAMATAYIVANPLSGATRSKALYRVLGTVLGAAAAVAFVPLLVDAPVLLSLAIAGWTGLCLAISLTDRSPRSYVFMLAGYSAPIIGFPAVADPAAIFDTAVARTEEITLGILCASLVSTIVFPASVGPVLDARIGAWLDDAARWCRHVLAPRRGEPGTSGPAAAPPSFGEDRRRLAADVNALDQLMSHLSYDPAVSPAATRAARLLRSRMVVLLPVISSIEDRLESLSLIGGIPADVRPLLSDLAAWIDAAAQPQAAAALHSDAGTLRARIAELEPRGEALRTWDGLLLSSLLLRLGELVSVWEDCRALRSHIARGDPAPARFARSPSLRAVGTHTSAGLAVFSGVSVALAIMLCCVFWIGSGWPEGAMAAQMVAVGCSFFAAQDDPTPAIVRFMAWTAVAVVVAAGYIFAVLPAVQGFPALVLVLAPVFLLYGALVARPSTYGAGMPLAVNTASIMAIQGTYQADFAAFANGALAMLSGMGLAAVFTSLVRAAGADWTARQLLRAGWADLAALAAGRSRHARDVFAGLMLDRLGQLAPKLAVSQEAADDAAIAVLRELRTGLNLLDLQRDKPLLDAPARSGVRRVLHGVAGHFRRRARDGRSGPPGPALLRMLDATIGVLGPAHDDAGRNALHALVGLRQALFPSAPAYRPPARPAGEVGAAALEDLGA